MPRSRAAAAAEKVAQRASADGRWSRAMVERAGVAFLAVDRIPEFDDDAIRLLVRDFLRFVHRVDVGGIDDDALPLARVFVERGYAWLAEHPHYAPLATKAWTVEMIEALILWFNDSTSGTPDRQRVLDVTERFHTFERVVRTGAVEPGEAEALADAFIDYAHHWLRTQPDAVEHYASL